MKYNYTDRITLIRHVTRHVIKPGLSHIATLNKEASLKTGTEYYNNKTAITEARIFKASSVMARNLQENYNTV